MKKLLSYVILFVLGTVTAAAQATMAYDVKGTVGTYEEITGGTVIGAGLKGEDFAEKVFDRDGHAIAKDTVTQGFPIGFDFKFNNKLMNQFAVSSTGYMLLGKDSVSVCNSSQNTINIISQDGVKDLLGVMPRTNTYGLDDTEISYKLIGTAPNRTLVVQYKNLAQNTRLWEDNFIPVQLQIRLHESDSSFDIIFKDWKPNDEDMITYLTIKIGAKGDGDDILLLGDSYTDFTLGISDATTVPWNNDVYPADGQTFTFTPPADCEKPAAQPTGLSLNCYSTRMEGSFKPSETADHYLTLITSDNSLSEMPVDGKFYAAGDSIGNALVVAYDTTTVFATPDILDGAKVYTVYVFAANSYCMYGPKYLTKSPLNGIAATKPAAPEEFSADAVDIDKLHLNITANKNDDRVLIAITTEPAKSAYGDVIADGVFGEPSGEMSVGDSIEGGGKVVYSGYTEDNITVEGLKENTVYFLRAWSIDGSGNYSTTTAKAMTSTGGTVPYSPDFTNMVPYEIPAGWTCEGNPVRLVINRDGTWTIENSVSTANASKGTESVLTTPWIKLSDKSNRILMDVNFTRYEGWSNGVYNNWLEGDTLLVQVSPDGKDFTTVYSIGPSSAPQMSSLDSYVTLRMPFDGFSGQNVKVRIYWKTFSNPKMNMANFKIEEKDDCDYPVNLRTVDGSVVGTSATIDWDRQGNENEWEMRYRVSGTEEWGDVIPVLSKPFTMTDLPGMTDIDVQLRAKCDAASASRWSDTYTFRTGYTVPFSEKFDGSSLPAGWEPRMGELATPTEFSDEESESWIFSSGFYNRGLMFSPVSQNGCSEWLLFPEVDMEDGSANYVLTIYTSTLAESESADDKYSIVVSRDGGNTYNESDVVKTFTAADMPALYESGSISVPLRGYTGVIRPAFYISSTSGYPMTFKLDSVVVSPTCPVDVSDIVLSDTTETSVKVSWKTNAEKSYVFIRKAGETVKPYVETAETSMTFDGLEPRTDYEIGITKVCEPGDTAKVTITRFATLAATGCPEVTDVKAEVEKYGAVLTWAGEGQSYNIRYRKAGTDAWTKRTTTENTYKITDLDQDTEYEYGIQTLCSTLESDTSAYTKTAVLRTLPETCFAPEDITVNPSYNSAAVTWVGEAESYKLAYAKADSDKWTEIPVSGESYTIEGLEPSTAYKLRMRSFCSAADSSRWSADVNFSTTAIPECVTPYDLAVSEISETSAVLTWNADESNLRWNIHYRKNTVSAWTEVNGLQTTSYELSGLDDNSTYIWSVMAECEANESKWATQNRFNTGATSIGIADLTGIKVFVKNHILNVINPENSYIRSIRIFGVSGQLIKNITVDTSDNVFTPLTNISDQVLLIKIDGKEYTRTVKVSL